MYDDSVSTIVDEDAAGQTFYEVTIASELLNANINQSFVAYTFTTPGPSDPRRMMRAACFFDTALFTNGTQRDQIMLQNEADQNRTTTKMFSAMKTAYTVSRDLCAEYDADPIFFIIEIRKVIGSPLVSTPYLFWLATKPGRLVHPFNPCPICGRVQEHLENQKNGVACCALCSSTPISP